MVSMALYHRIILILLDLGLPSHALQAFIHGSHCNFQKIVLAGSSICFYFAVQDHDNFFPPQFTQVVIHKEMTSDD